MGNLIGPQDILNRLTAGLLETIKASLIPTIITPRNSVSRGAIPRQHVDHHLGRQA